MGALGGIAADAPNIAAVVREANIEAVLDELDRELVALRPVKTRIREISALLVIDQLRRHVGLAAGAEEFVADVVAAVDLQHAVRATVGRPDERQASPAVVDHLQVGAGTSTGERAEQLDDQHVPFLASDAGDDRQPGMEPHGDRIVARLEDEPLVPHEM